MKKYRSLLISLIAWVAYAPPTLAQFLCTVAPVQHIKGQHVYYYSTLSCKGSICMVAADAVNDTDTAAIYGHVVFLRSIDGGHSWTLQDPGLSGDTIASIGAIDQIDSLNIFAVGGFGLSQNQNIIIRTNDGGATWQQISAPTQHPILSINFRNEAEGIAIAYDGTFITSDGGAQWDTILYPRGYLWRCHAYGDGNYRVFKYSTGEIYTTTNNWISFDSTKPIISDSNLRRHYIYEYCSFGSGDTIFAYGYHSQTACIARTTDGGHHWSSVYDDTTGISAEVVSLSDVNRDTIVAGENSYPNVVFWSTNNGMTWEVDSLLCNDTSFNGYENDGIGLNSQGELVGAFNSEVIPFQTGQVTYSVIIGKRATSRVFSNNISSPTVELFPNPATSSITMPIAAGISRFYLFDILGREVLSRKVPSTGLLTLDVSNLPRGMYEVRIEKDGQMLPSGKIILN